MSPNKDNNKDPQDKKTAKGPGGNVPPRQHLQEQREAAEREAAKRAARADAQAALFALQWQNLLAAGVHVIPPQVEIDLTGDVVDLTGEEEEDGDDGIITIHNLEDDDDHEDDE